jgi:hypothetical protein
MEKNKELEIALTTYIALKHSQEECAGFIDGFKEAQALQLLQTDVSMRSEQFTAQDSKEFILWQKCMGIKRIHNNIYKWNEFGYERSFFLEKYQEHLNKVN